MYALPLLKNKKDQTSGSIPWQIVAVVLIAITIPVAVFLTQQRQDIRQQASTPSISCATSGDQATPTRWGWLCTGSNVTNRLAEYYAYQCPQNNLSSCGVHNNGTLIPLTCSNIENNATGSFNCIDGQGFLKLNLSQSQMFFTNGLPLGQCGCVQTDIAVKENGVNQVAGGETRCFSQACSTALSCNQSTGTLLTHSQGGSNQGVLTPSTPDLTFQVNVSGSNIERTEICFAGKKNSEGTQFTGAKCLRQVSPNTTFSYNGNPAVFNFVPGTTAMTIPPANGLTYNYIAAQLGMTEQEKQNGIVWGVNILTADSLCEGGSGRLLSRSTGQQIGSCSVNASCKGTLKISSGTTPLSCNQLTGNLASYSLNGSSAGTLAPSTTDLKFNLTVSGTSIERTEVCFIGRRNAEGTQFTGAKCLRQVSPNTTFSYNGNPAVFNFVPGTTAMTIPPANGLTYNYISTQLGMTEQEKAYGINWGVNVLTVDTLCEGSTGKLLSRSTGQQIGNCSVNASCKGALKISTLPQCVGVAISCSGQCAANGGVDYTCNWTKPAGATEFTMAFKDTAASGSAWMYENSSNTSIANRWLNDKTRWVKSFATNVSRDFMLRIYTSTACTPHVGAYGNKATVASPTCGSLTCNQDCVQHSQCQSGHCAAGKCKNAACVNSATCACATPPPTPTPPPGPICQDVRIYKLNGSVNELSSWGEPLTAEKLAVMSAEGTINPGTELYFTVTGNNANNSPLINYQKGRIRVHMGTNQGGFVETTNQKPSDGNVRRVEYYIKYTVPAYNSRTTFTLEGEVCAAQGDTCTWH